MSSRESQFGRSSTTVMTKNVAGTPSRCRIGRAFVNCPPEASSKETSTALSASGVPSCRWSTSASPVTGCMARGQHPLELALQHGGRADQRSRAGAVGGGVLADLVVAQHGHGAARRDLRGSPRRGRGDGERRSGRRERRRARPGGGRRPSSRSARRCTGRRSGGRGGAPAQGSGPGPAAGPSGVGSTVSGVTRPGRGPWAPGVRDVPERRSHVHRCTTRVLERWTHRAGTQDSRGCGVADRSAEPGGPGPPILTS